MLSSVGCSGFAAGIMAIFLENAESIREKKRITKARQIYFDEMNNQLTMTIERILWFDERLQEDNFNWSLNPSEYSSLRYGLFSHSISKERRVSFQEAEKMLLQMGNKYNLENIRGLSEEQRLKVQKMFQIVATGCSYLLREMSSIIDNKLRLDTEKYISIKESEELSFNISLAAGIMLKTDKNYDVAIKSLLAAAKKIRGIGNYDNDVRIALHGNIPISEL